MFTHSRSNMHKRKPIFDKIAFNTGRKILNRFNK